MTPVDFLKERLRLIAEKFLNVHIKYGYNNLIDTHIVELLPLSEFTKNADLDNAWIPLSLEFMETFKNEEVAFISSDSSLSINDVIFEFNATRFYKDVFVEDNWNKILSTFANLDLGTKFQTSSFVSCDFEELSEPRGMLSLGVRLFNGNKQVISFISEKFIFEDSETIVNEDTLTSTEPDLPMAA